MTDHDLDALLASANPVSDRALATLPLDASEAALRDGLLAVAPSGDPVPRLGRPPRRRRRLAYPRLPRLAAGGLAIAALAALALVLLLPGGKDGASGGTAWAAPLVQLAESSPLLLLDGGWTVTRADETSRTEGEMTFTRAGRSADLHWQPEPLARWQEDRAMGAAFVVKRTVLGHPAQVSRYAGTPGPLGDFTALWGEDGRVLELRAPAEDLAAFEALLGALRRVDVDAWLTAMPASVVKAGDRPAAVREMLKGVPLPPGFDATVLDDGPLKDRYQLGAEVTSAVGCTWFARWDAARKAGDAAGEAAAVAALRTAKDWPVLGAMRADGAWTEVLLEYVAAMPSGRWYGRPLMGDVKSGLGCERWWG